MQCSAVQCSAVQCSAVQCSAVQCSAVQCSAVQCSAVEAFAVPPTCLAKSIGMKLGPLHSASTLHCTAHRHCTSSVLHCTALHCTALHTAHTALHCTAVYCIFTKLELETLTRTFLWSLNYHSLKGSGLAFEQTSRRPFFISSTNRCGATLHCTAMGSFSSVPCGRRSKTLGIPAHPALNHFPDNAAVRNHVPTAENV